MKSKRELFEDVEEQLRKQQKTQRPAPKPTPKKEEKKPAKKTDKKEPQEPTLDQLVNNAAEEFLKPEDTDKDVTTLLIEETKKKQIEEGNTSDKAYGEEETESSAGNVYERIGSSGGGYANIGGGNPYQNIGGGGYAGISSAYGAASGGYGPSSGGYDVAGAHAYGTPDQQAGVGVYESAGSAAARALDVGGLQQKLNQADNFGLSPQRKAHESHKGGAPVGGCSYCAKAMGH